LALLVLSGALGLYAYQQKSAATTLGQQKAETQSQLEGCTKERDDEKSKRETSEKTAASASTDLAALKGELDDLRVQKAEADKRAELFKSITDKFRKMIDSGKLTVIMRHGRMVVKLPAGVLFPSGSAELSKEGQSALSDVAKILKQVPDRRFEVAGHTDNIPLQSSSPFKTNLELSAERGVAVAVYLVSQGLSAYRLSAAGYAEHEPVASNASEAGRQENRRIEIVLLPNLSELPFADLDGGAK
jgi:chemotaxis protein MotB